MAGTYAPTNDMAVPVTNAAKALMRPPTRVKRPNVTTVTMPRAGEYAERGEHRPERPSRHEIVRLGADASRYEHPDAELREDVPDDAPKNRWSSSVAAFLP